MMVGIKYHLHNLRRLLAWKNDKRKLSNPPNYNFVHFLIAFNIFDKLLYYFIKSFIIIGWIILLQ